MINAPPPPLHLHSLVEAQVLGIGYFAGLKVNYSKTVAVVKVLEGRSQPVSVAGITVKPVKLLVKYLQSLLGNVTSQRASGPAIAKMMARVKTLATLALGMEEKAYLFASWVAPVVYLTGRAHELSDKVFSQLNLVQRIVLGINSWHLTMGILSMPKREGVLAHHLWLIIFLCAACALPVFCDHGLQTTCI